MPYGDETNPREKGGSTNGRLRPFERPKGRPEGVSAQREYRGRPPKEAPKVAVTMRLDREVAEFFRSSGEGWQTRMNALLAAHVKRE